MSASDNDSDVSEEGILLKIEPKGSRDCSVSTSASNGCILYFFSERHARERNSTLRFHMMNRQF